MCSIFLFCKWAKLHRNRISWEKQATRPNVDVLRDSLIFHYNILHVKLTSPLEKKLYFFSGVQSRASTVQFIPGAMTYDVAAIDVHLIFVVALLFAHNGLWLADVSVLHNIFVEVRFIQNALKYGV